MKKNILIDDENLFLLKKYKWFINNKYVYTQIKGKTKYLHRMIMGDPECNIDHINGNPLDNRIENLRLVNQSQNNMNARKRKNTTSKYKGVSYRKDTNKWTSYIHIKPKAKKNLGCYDCEEKAALAYNKAALSHFGQYARLNEVE